MGVVVGELNTILYTKNGGYKWERIEVADFSEYNYNKALYTTNSSFYVAGDNGVLIEFINSAYGWTAYKRRVSQIEDSVDEYILVENINDLNYYPISNIKIGYKNYLVKYYLQKIKIDSLNNLKGLSDQSINKLQNAPIFKKYFELSIGSGGSMFTGSVSSPSIFTNEVTVNRISESKPWCQLIRAGFTEASASVLAEFTNGIKTGVKPAAGI